MSLPQTGLRTRSAAGKRSTRLARRALIAVLAGGLIAGVTGTILSPAAVAVTTVKTTANVNVRTGPGTSYTILGVLPSGSTITALGGSSNGWTPVSYSGRTAYIYTYYLTTVASSTPTFSSTTSTLGTATAIEDLNVRTGPGITYSVYQVALKGTVFTLTGLASSGFRQVSFAGGKYWVSEAWIVITPAPTPSPTPTVTVTPTTSAKPTTTASATASASSTAGAATSTSTSTSTASATTSATSTASSSASSSASSTASATSSSTATATATSTASTTTNTCSNLPAVTGQVRATAALMIRTTNDANFVNLGDVPAGTILDVTGVITNGVAQIVYQCAVRWVNANYIAALVPNLPAPITISGITVTGQRYALVDLNVYTSSTDTTAEDLVTRGTLVPITGNNADGRAEIVWNGVRRWVNATFLSTMAPSSATDQSVGLAGLGPNASKIVADVRVRFTAIFTIYGVRPDTYPDHPSGLAVDLMLPQPYLDPASQALGKSIAEYYKANAKAFGVQYIIFNQYIWNIERDAEGWRYMADRGSDTANHVNHVHITTY